MSSIFGSLVSGPDEPLIIGEACLEWDTADANANMLKLGLPAGDATNVPVFLTGIESAIKDVDLGIFNGTTQPKHVMTSADASKWMGYGWNGVFFEFLGKDVSNQILFNTPVNFNSTFIVAANADILFGTQGRIGGNSVIGTADLRLGVQNDAPFVLCTALNQDVAFNAGTSADPKFYITSQTSFSTATDEWLSLVHDTTDAVLETGSGNFVFTPFGGQLIIPTGSATTPSIGISGETNTGFWGDGAGSVFLGTGGVTRVTVNSGGIISSAKIRVPDGTAAAPTYTFSNDTDTGLYRSGINEVGITTGGNLGFSIDNDGVTIVNGQIVNVTTVNAATYDLLATDYILNVTYTTTGAVTSLTLPSAQVVSGRTIIIKDAGGNAGTNNITIDTGGSETIDGAATAVISTNYASVTLYSDGSNWFII